VHKGVAILIASHCLGWMWIFTPRRRPCSANL